MLDYNHHYDILCTLCIYKLIWQFFHIYVQYMYSPAHTYVPILVYTCCTYISTNTKIHTKIHTKIRTVIQTIMYIYTCHYGSEISICANTYRTVCWCKFEIEKACHSTCTFSLMRGSCTCQSYYLWLAGCRSCPVVVTVL